MKSFLVFSVIAGFTLSTNSPTGQVIAQYDFEACSGAVLPDISGNGHNGTITNAVWTNASCGGSCALEFDGASARVAIPYHNDFDIRDSLVVEACLKVDPAGIGNASMIVQGGRWEFAVAPTGPGILVFNVWLESGQRQYVSDWPVPLDGLFHRVSFDFNSDRIRFCVDGELAGESETNSKIIAAEPQFDIYIGSYRPEPPWFYFGGVIDELRISHVTELTCPSQFGSVCASVNIAGDPPLPAQGVTVTVLDQNNDPVGEPQLTDENGEAFFDSILVGEYSVMIVTPLGYSVSPAGMQENIVVTGGECSGVAFVITPTIISNECRKFPYWKHQFNVYTSGHGHAHEDSADLETYLDLVHQHFDVLGVYFDLENYDFEDAKNILAIRGNIPMVDKARRQLFTLLLNFASGRIGNETVVSDDGRVAAEAVTFIAALINDGEPANDELAMRTCRRINNGQMVGGGIIPQSPIRYKFEPKTLPQTFLIEQNHPNPFNASTTIRYDLPIESHVTIEIYDILGRKIETLVSNRQTPGSHSVIWNAKEIPSGVYFYRLSAAGFVQTKRMTVAR